MNNSKKEKILIVICASCVMLTLFFRSALHEITLPLSEISDLQTKSGAITNDVLTVHFHERRPYYVSYKDEVHGLVADPIAKVLDSMGINFTWKKSPAKLQLDLVKGNESEICIAGWYKTPARELFAKYSLPIYQDKPLVVVTRANNERLDNVETIESVLSEDNLRLLVKVGYSYGTELDMQLKRLKPWQVYTNTDNQSMLKMIQTHRADYCFMAEEEAQDLLLFSGISQHVFKVIKLSDMVPGNKRYLLCSQKVPDKTMAQIDKGIQHFINIQEETP